MENPPPIMFHLIPILKRQLSFLLTCIHYIMTLQFMIVIYTRFARQSLLYHEAMLHDRHSPFAECINAFFSLALIISYPCNVRTRRPLLQPFCCFALLSQTHSLYSILSAFHPPLTLCKASYQVLSLLNDLFCFLFFVSLSY